jgi:hypothetical protein
MFSYFGSKYRLSKHYPSPLPGFPVVEPFAGSAAYSLYHNVPRAILYDVNPTICGVWDYLIHVSGAEIRTLPDRVSNVDDIAAPPEARDLIGFWLGKARGTPARRNGGWGERHYSDTIAHVWGPGAKARIASQVDKIRDWRIVNADYRACPQIKATWFLDPPYVVEARRTYRFKDVDYTELAAFVRARGGLVISCDSVEADYLPFSPFRITHGVSRQSREGVWVRRPKGRPKIHATNADRQADYRERLSEGRPRRRPKTNAERQAAYRARRAEFSTRLIATR